MSRPDPRSSFRRSWVIGAAVALLAAGCSGDSSEEAASQQTSASPTASPVTNTMSAADAAAIDDAANEALAANPALPGLWIGVWDPDRGTYLAAYGEAVEGGTAATVEESSSVTR